MEDQREILRRLAIAVETLAQMTLEALNRIESRLAVPPPAAKPHASTTRYWLQYVIGPIVGVVVTTILTHLALKK